MELKIFLIYFLKRSIVVPAGTESGAGVTGAGGRPGHVQRVRGAGALQARRGFRLLERMERLSVLQPEQQQRYRRKVM